MKSIKPGRGPSMMGGIVCIAVAVFGLLWTIGASSMTSSFGGIGTFHDPAFGGGIDAIFPLFGVVFIIIAVVSAVYNFKNATGKKRFSEYDIMDSSEETDPLNVRFGETASVDYESIPKTDAFCPYCGTPVEDDYRSVTIVERGFRRNIPSPNRKNLRKKVTLLVAIYSKI